MQKVFRSLVVAIVFTMAVALVGVARPASADTATVPLLVTVNTTSNVYDAPSTTAGNVIGTLLAGQNWFVMGTDSTATWTQVQITPLIYGWAPTSVFGLSGVTLPVIAGFTAGPVTAPAATAVSAAAASSTVATVPLLVGVNTTTTVYDAPSTTNSDVSGTLTAGQTWFVTGTDTTGKWTQVQITPLIYAWAPTSALGLAGVTLPVIAGVTGS